jgi:hypothetical protein
MSQPEGITNALLTVEASAAQLEGIGQSQDEEFHCLLCEIAQNLRLLAGGIVALSEAESECDSVVA